VETYLYYKQGASLRK